MKIIVAVDNDWCIGKNGKLLAYLPADMKFFKETTIGHTVVMGRKTWDSLPKRPLPNRINGVLSRTLKSIEGAKIFSSINEIPSDAFIIGGGEIYKELLPYCSKIYMTKYNKSFENDTYFEIPNDIDEWEVTYKSEDEEFDGATFNFLTYERKSKDCTINEDGGIEWTIELPKE